MHHSNIASHLSLMAKRQPDTLAVAVQANGSDFPRYTYKELDEISELYARGLMEVGLIKGTRTVLMVGPGLAFFAMVFALFKIGAVMVIVDPGMGIRNLGKCLAESEPQAFIGVRAAHLARLLLGWGRGTVTCNIVIEPYPLFAWFLTGRRAILSLGRTSARRLPETDRHDQAAILFTSGSTGVPKGVCYTHGNFTAQVEEIKRLYAIEPGEIDLATFPLFALFAPALGMSSIIPDMDFAKPGAVNPGRLFAAIERFKPTTMFGSPALLDRMAKWGLREQKRIHSVRRVLSAGAPVSKAIQERFTQFLAPDVHIYTPYGATEALPVASVGSDTVLNETGVLTERGKGVCVGYPVESIHLKIIKISDAPFHHWDDGLELHAGEIGEIVVQGPQVTGRYYNRPVANTLAKIRDNSGRFYHRMGDVGYLDEKGRLWFCGRLSQRVVVGHETLFTACCEGIFNAHHAVSRTALVGVKQNDQTLPVICVELQARTSRSKNIIRELRMLGQRYEQTKGIEHFLFHSRFPVDIRHNAKIGREKLAIWAARELCAHW